MNAARNRIDPICVRLSGEIVDDSLIRALSIAYPRAHITQAYASTEAGVVFEVEDEQAGFPSRYFDAELDGVALKLVDGSLRVRSGGTALGYLGPGAQSLFDEEGYVDTGDLIQRAGARCYFSGRRGGIINIGGAKVHPEEVEAVINSLSGVKECLVKARRNPITGFLIVADVVLKPGVVGTAQLKDEIMSACARDLAPHKAPALISFVQKLPMTSAGKLARN